MLVTRRRMSLRHLSPLRLGRTRRGAVAVGCAALALGGAGMPRPGAIPVRAAYSATVLVEASGGPVGVTDGRYIGLSFESGTLNGGRFDDGGNLAPLLRNLGHGVMRFGGNSVDQSYGGITPGALAGLARLTKASGWSVLYSENLGHFDAAAVTSDAAAVRAALGPALSALACGNEPDLFSHARQGLRPVPYTEAEYQAQAGQCLAAVRAGAPNAPLEGPDTASAGWLPGYAAAQAGQLAWVGQHYYPMGCGLGGRTPAAFATAMLSPAQTAKEAAFFASAAAVALTAHAPLRISETNTACGGGAVGVSDAYASALWVIDYLLTGAEHGVRGFNFHGALDGHCTGYTPLCQVGPGRYAAQPLYYGLLFTHQLGIGKLVPVTVITTQPDANLAAFALQTPSGRYQRLMLENLAAATASVTLRPGSSATSATVWTMTGPSLLATSGVRIQGAKVAANGSFALARPRSAPCVLGGCYLTLAPYSAAIVSVG